MANVSSSNGIEHLPKIRFSGFPFVWEDCVLSNVLTERKEFCEKDGTYEHATLSKDGIYGKTDRYNRDFLVADENKAYKITHKWDLCYNPANLKFGVICLNTYGDAIFSPIYVTFNISNSFSKEFIGYALSRWNFINRALKFQQGTVYERMAVSPEDFLTIHCRFPKLNEQEKIANFLRLIDQRITKQTEYVEHLKKYKRGVIQAVFDDEKRDLFGEISSGKQVKLSDLMDFQNGINADASKYGRGIRYISVSDILKNNFITYDKIIGQVDIDSRALATYSVTYGDVLFQRSSETREDAGRSNVYLDTEKTATFGGFVIRGKKKSDYDPLYLKYALDSFVVRKQIMQCAAGAQHINVSQEDLCNVVVNLPAIDVQNRISKFISNIDLRITTEEKKANAQATLKKALLQQLFI